MPALIWASSSGVFRRIFGHYEVLNVFAKCCFAIAQAHDPPTSGHAGCAACCNRRRGLAGFDVQAWSKQATEHDAHIRAKLERVGNSIGAMELLIAAHALANDSVLVINNPQEFARVRGLAVEEWPLT